MIVATGSSNILSMQRFAFLPEEIKQMEIFRKKNGHISFRSLTSRSIAFEMLKLFIYGSHNDLTDNILNSINFI